MSEGKGSEPVNGVPVKGPLLRIVIEAQGGQVRVQGNLPWRAMVSLLTDAMVALAQGAVREEDKRLVKPVGAVPPPLPPPRLLP